MGEEVVKGKWLRRLPFVRDLFERRIEEIEKNEIEVPNPAETVSQLREGIRGKKVKPKYITSFLDVFKEKRRKLRKRVRIEANSEHKKRLRLELKALEKSIASVEQSLLEQDLKRKTKTGAKTKKVASR